jgi:hypothetical protein
MTDKLLTLAEEVEAGWILQQLQAYALGLAGAGAMTEQKVDVAMTRLDEFVPDAEPQVELI